MFAILVWIWYIKSCNLLWPNCKRLHHSITKWLRRYLGGEDFVLLRSSVSNQQKPHVWFWYWNHFSYTISMQSRKRTIFKQTSKLQQSYYQEWSPTSSKHTNTVEPILYLYICNTPLLSLSATLSVTEKQQEG